MCARKETYAIYYDASVNNIKLHFRLFWLLCIGGSLVFFFISSRNLYDDWKNSPVITNIDSTIEKVGNVPFPAFAICNNNQADINRLKRYSIYVFPFHIEYVVTKYISTYQSTYNTCLLAFFTPNHVDQMPQYYTFFSQCKIDCF